MMQSQRVLTVIFIASVCVGAQESPPNELKDYCSVNKFQDAPIGLGFTKEVVAMEYANLGAFKAIHCCLRGYRSIEW